MEVARQPDPQIDYARRLDRFEDGKGYNTLRRHLTVKGMITAPGGVLLRLCGVRLTKGVGFAVLQQGAIDTIRSDGRLMLNILASFSEFEADIRKERQADGIAKAKAEGVYRGRAPSISPEQVRAMRAAGKGATEIARELKIGRASVYRLLT